MLLKLLSNSEISDVDFYFEPMCGDSGLSIGYAMSHYGMRGGVPEPLGTTFLHGDVYENNHVGEEESKGHCKTPLW